MLRPSNLFKNQSNLFSAPILPQNQVHNNITPTSNLQKQEKPQNTSYSAAGNVKTSDMESKLEKISKEVSNFILDSKNAYTEQKKELVNILEKFAQQPIQQPLQQQQIPLQYNTKQLLNQDKEEKMQVGTFNTVQSVIETNPNKEFLKQKRHKKTYSKVVGDVIDKIKMLYPSLKNEHFDKLYISGEDIYYKGSNKYVLLDTQLYCKLSK